MRLFTTLAVVLLACVALPTNAVSQDMAADIGFVVGFVAPTSDFTDEDGDSIEWDSTVGFGGLFKYRFSENMSFGASILTAKHDGRECDGDDGQCGTLGEINNMPVLFDLNFHFNTAGGADPYLGLTLGYSLWGDFEFDDPDDDDVPFKNSLAYGVNFGLDFPFADGWKFIAGGRYLIQESEVDEQLDPDDVPVIIDVDPFILTVGVARRF